MWPSLLNVFFVILLDICLVTVFILDVSDIESIWLFLQAVVLLLITVVNIVLEVYELLTRHVWHIRRCMSHSDNFMGLTPCPWLPSSYPSQPITTLRSQVTVRGLRDRQVVNIPCSLLVEGDIIQLDPNTPSPARVRLFDRKKRGLLSTGDAPSKLFSYPCSGKPKLIEEDEFYWFVVLETPVIRLLENSVASSPPPTMLFQQKQLVSKAVLCMAIMVFGLSLVFTIARKVSFPRYFMWEDTVLVLVYTILPMLAPSFGITWAVMNAYGMVALSMKLKSKPPVSNNIWSKPINSLIMVKEIVKAVLFPYEYPLPEHTHSLGALTAICAVDKEYLLTGGMPIPEKVFFLRSEGMEHVKQVESTSEYTSVPSSSAPSSPTDGRAQSGNKEGAYLSSSIEIVPETLGMSVNSEHLTGLSFDDPKWYSHINSLKPIGLNAFTTSHALQSTPIHNHTVASFGLQHYLYKTQCSCTLALEIGVSEYPDENFLQPHLFYLIGDQNQNEFTGTSSFPRSKDRVLMQKIWNEFVQPHLISMVVEDQSAQQKLLMSRGSADLVVQCCQDFWDGNNLQPMTEAEKTAILDFFTRKTLSAYCIALAYSPISKQDPLNNVLSHKSMGVYIPEGIQENVRLLQIEDHPSDAVSPSNVVSWLSNQVFLGMVSLQYQPKQDIIALVQNLEQSGIRFIQYTAENEVRGKIFAEKLGLEAGWNCHISLSSAGNVEDEKNEVEENELEDDSTSSASSILYNLYQEHDAYIKAKLPKGVEEIRSHIENVDNVPLLVPLYTDCTPDAVTEMIKIMQENGEVVLCMGNAWVRENIGILAQANIGMSFTPSPEDIGSGDCAVFSNTYTSLQDWPTPMEAASSLNSLTSGAYLARNANVSLVSIVEQCRHVLGCIQRGLLCFLALSLSITLLLLLSNFLFLPRPLSGDNMFWFMFINIPLLSLSLLSIGKDQNITTRLPDRKTKVWNMEWKYYIIYFFVVYLPIALVSLAIFWLTLNGLCTSAENYQCDSLLGNTNQSTTLGWNGANNLGLFLAQNYTAFFLVFYLVVSTGLFIDDSKLTWKALRHVSWQYIGILSFILISQIIFSLISQYIQASIFKDQTTFHLNNIPFYVWIIGFLWIIPQLVLQELVKIHNQRVFIRTQTRLKLSFETKLGMNSPF